jgi:hypothetical protein
MVTKRQLGIIVIALGLLVLLSTVGIDLIGAGGWSGFGPLQRIGLGLGIAVIGVGAILVCLGNHPA